MHTHDDFKTALRLFNTSIAEFSRNLIRPDGTKGVSRTAVTRVSQGHEEIEWIAIEIDRVINKARNAFPEYYKKKDKISA